MEPRERISGRRGRLGTMVLAAVLACALLLPGAAAAVESGGMIIAAEAAPKPIVTLQGNVVVDKGKPTGFYELALCVRTARTVTANDNTQTPEQAEAAYAELLEEAAKTGDRTAVEEFLTTHTVQHYPFQSAAAAVHINLYALTAVSWGAGKPVYETWRKDSGRYDSYDDAYPRGIDLTTKDKQPDIFTDLSPLDRGAPFVRLDAAHPDEMTTASAFIEAKNDDDGLLTLAAATTTTANVIYERSTPVVVVRFAYDMDRFTQLDVGDPHATPAVANTSDFWLGKDRSGRNGGDAARTPLTYLADSVLDAAAVPTQTKYTASDEAAAASTAHQTVWYEQNMAADQVTQRGTRFYYYLKEENMVTKGSLSFQVVDLAAGTQPPDQTLMVPETEGQTVLANVNAAWPTVGGATVPETNTDYSFFQNLLTLKSGTLKLELVNAETYRKSSGGGGITILFYDWDDSLIGSLVVDKGDVRAEVEAYVEENMVHPALRPSAVLKAMGGKLPEDWTTAVAGDVNARLYQELIESLAREYTYRGKYAYTVGGDDAALGVTDGGEYPLTNKLDYAFYRRVNRTVAQTNADGATTIYYNTTSPLDADNLDAGLYPYAYGWAVVEDTGELNTQKWQVRRDAQKLPDVWTTVGVGELSGMKPGVGRTDMDTPAGQGVTEPAFIAYETAKKVKLDPTAEPKSEDYPYQFTTASNAANRYLRFADFSDIDAELARGGAKTESGAGKNTLIVKAVYEPGPALLQGISYRLYKEPTYNKLNNLSAAEGGAYSVKVVMERASDDTGKVQGVSRVRLPAVRQDTTVDQKWIQDNALGVDHNLDNATIKTAKGLTETTYTKIDVDNGELVEFSMSLSARQNKVDYFIIEQFGNNFVSGAQRSQTNYDRKGNAFAVDNYNYFLDGDSDTNDPYFDVKDYADREGSHGFVLYGTLNNLMQVATMYNNQEVTNEKFNQVVNFLNMRDANLRSDAVGTVAAANREEQMQNKLRNAAQECETNHKGDPDFWNNELDCAELNYHQLQWYIIDGTLRDRATADSEKLSFCHLHAACAELVSNKPKTWADVMEAAAQRDADRLKQLSFDELKDLTHLRNNVNGGDFSGRDVMITRLINAVNGDATLTDWVDVQKALLNGNGGVDTYWWYDGSQVNSAPTNFDGLLDRAIPAFTPTPYPDGVGRYTRAKLESVRSMFEANAAAGPNKATRQWINVTNNLVLAHREEQVEIEVNGETMEEWHYTYTPLNDFEAFEDALVETMVAAMGVGQANWESVQYHLLFPEETLDFINEPWTNVKLLNTDGWDPDADPPPKQWPEGFWWKGGNIPLTVNNVYTLLEAMKLLNGEDKEQQDRAKEALKALDLARLEGKDFWLRKSKTGETWLERDESGAVTGPDAATQATRLAQLLKDIQAAQAAGANSWNTLQYYLIHKDEDPMPDVNDFAKVNAEVYYYWWRQGGTGKPVDFSRVTNLSRIFSPLFEASIQAGEFGDPAATASVEAQKVDGSFFTLTHLTPAAPTAEQTTVGAMTWFTDTDTLLKKMNDFMKFLQGQQGITDPYAQPKNVDWYQAQHWLLTGEYITAGSLEHEQAKKDYWWYDKDEKPAEKPPVPDPTLAVLVRADAHASGGTKNVEVTADEWAAMNIIAPATTGKKGTKVTTLAQGKGNMKKLVAEAKKHPEYYDGTHVNVTWAQIQYYFVTALSGDKKGVLVTDAEAWTELKTRGWTAADIPEGVVIPAGVF